MSRIWGIATALPHEDIARGLRAQTEIICSGLKGGPETWHAPQIGLGHQTVGAFHRRPQPRHDADARRTCVYAGKIFDYDGLRGELQRDGERFEPDDEDPEFMSAWIRRHGFNRLAELNGLFACALWDEREKRLDLVTDRYGIRIIYYYHDEANGRLIFATELRGVVDTGLVDLKINWPAWSVFLAFGHNLGDETAFRNVFTVPLGCALTFKDNAISITRYWDPNDIRVDERMTQEQAIEGLASLFPRAMRRRNIPCRGRKTVFLSGGLDSRRIAAELHRQDARFTTHTAGYRRDMPEVVIAAQVAAALGVPHRIVELPDDFLAKYMTRGTALCDYETNLHQWVIPLVESLDEDMTLNHDGLGGDIPPELVTTASGLRRPGEFSAAMAMNPEARARRVSYTPVDFRVFHPDIRRNLSDEDVVAKVAAELRKYDVNDNQLCFFYVLNRSRRGVGLNAYRLILRRAETICPFLDNDLFDFTMRIPGYIRAERQLRPEAVCLAYPELTHVPRAPKDASRTSRPPRSGPDSRRSRRRYFLQNVRTHYVRGGWMFDKRKTRPILLRDAFKSFWQRTPTVNAFSLVNTVFFLFMERYFPGGESLFVEGDSP